LESVLEHYRTGIIHSSTLDPLLQNNISMTEEEKSKIILFLNTLNDEKFIKNPLFSEQ
jgi:cytochrome c peroxidase